MTCYFKRVTAEEIEVAIAGLDRCSFHDHRDGCRTVNVGCSCCDKEFSEELEAAKNNVRNRRPFLCLSCDPAADKYAFTGVTVEFGWRF